MINLDWGSIDGCVKHVCDVIDQVKPNIESVVGITVGGVIPATMIAKRLNLPLHFFTYNPEWSRFRKQLRDYNGELNNILLVDDICDSGQTFKNILYALYDEEYDINTIKTCALLYRDKSIYKPNLFAIKTFETDYYVFPWENIKQVPTEMKNYYSKTEK